MKMLLTIPGGPEPFEVDTNMDYSNSKTLMIYVWVSRDNYDISRTFHVPEEWLSPIPEWTEEVEVDE